jgi:hypothetical protein
MSNLKGKPLRVLWKKYLPLVMKRKKRMRRKSSLKLHQGRGLASKNASNAFVPSSRVEIKANMKKLSWWERYVLCMNVDIDKKLHSQYVRNKHIQCDQRRITDKLDIPKTDDEDQVSSSTLSYNAWNSKILVNWQDFEEVTGPSHGRASLEVEESEAEEEEEEEDGKNSDENEDSDEE